MADIQIRIEGLDKLRSALAGGSAVVRQEVKAAMHRSALSLEGRAKELTPVKTGTLRRSINSRVTLSGSAIEGRVGTPISYARWIETGKRTKSGGKVVYRRAGPARMFGRAVEEKTNAIMGYFKDAAAKIAAALAR